MLPQTDKGTIHLIIWIVAAVALASLGTATFLDYTGHDKNVNTLYNITVFLSGGILGLLTKTSTTPQPPPPTPVEVTNEKPIPVTEGEAP